MAPQKRKLILDGASLSPKIPPKGKEDPSLPIGKVDHRRDERAVARHYKHAAGKSSTYAPEVVDMIYHMARSGQFADDELCRFVAAKLDAEREISTSTPPPTFDQIVFLSANLTRLVIDPYREKCNSRVQIGPERTRPLTLAWPIVIGGVDFSRLPAPLLEWATAAAAGTQLAMIVDPDWSIDQSNPVQCIFQVEATRPLPDLHEAAAVLITAPTASMLKAQTIGAVVDGIHRQTDAQIPVGVTVPAFDSVGVVNSTVDSEVDFFVTDAQWTDDARPTEPLPEISSAPAIHVLADTMECLRQHCREESIQVIYRGGIRGGADAGKALCIGARAVSLGLSAIVGMGFRISRIADEVSLLKQLEQPLKPEDAVEHLVNFAKSINMEVTMLARACGKTSVINMEPEDLRALTVAVSAATGVPVAGKDYNYRTSG